MSKPIKLTEAYKDECRKAFEEALKLTRLSDGKINFTKSFESVDRKATVFFTPMAWIKMYTLLQGFNKEVGWYGVAERGEDDTYTISDILVYPQQSDGTNVKVDEAQLAIWLAQNDDDDRFHKIRMQGHSHVNMGTTPSATDLKSNEEIISMLGDEDFYIFMIYNKRLEHTYKIYDMQKNVLFETKDVTVKLHGDGEDLDAFLANAGAMVKEIQRATPVPKTPAAGQAMQAPKQTTPTSAAKPAVPNTKPATPAESVNKTKTTMDSFRSPGNSYGYGYDNWDDEEDGWSGYGYGYGYNGWAGRWSNR